MRLRVRLKSLALLALLSSIAFLYNFVGVHLGSLLETGDRSPKTHRVARITAEDLLNVGRYPDLEQSSTAVRNTGRNPFGTKTITNTTDIKKLHVTPNDHGGQLMAASDSIMSGRLESQAPLVRPQGQETLVPSDAPLSPVSKNAKNNVHGTYCDGSCQFRRLREESLAALAQIRARKSTKIKDGVHLKGNICDKDCRMAKIKKYGRYKGGYSSRVQVENVTLPNSWTVTQELVDRLSYRRNHVHEVCKKYGLDKPSKSYHANAWEFLVNAKYGLVWCNVFKAASSTWFYNFNLLAGFSEQELLHAKETPIQLARKRYARPSVDELQQALNSTRQPLSFMIARHPLHRLVSGYRDKILSGNRYYSKLARTILRQYKDMKHTEKDNSKAWAFFGRSAPKSIVPSFPQFAQYLIEEAAVGHRLDEHWTPIHSFCTPCLVDFDVFAKVETMEEDGNYIIFSAGIQDVIKPKRINRARNEPTDAVADKFLCQLSEKQMDGLIDLYKYDIELFEYDVSKYINCTRS